MHLGIDIDNTVSYTTESVVRWYNLTLRKNIRPNDITTYYVYEAYNLSNDEAKRLWKRLEHSIYHTCEPLEDAAATISSMAASGHQITFITARPNVQLLARTTKQWLKRHDFPFTGDNLVMGAYNKAKVAKDLGVELFFDDFPSHIESLLRARIPAVVVDAPYNAGIPATERLHNWKDALTIVAEVEHKMKSQLSLFDFLENA